MTKHLNGDVPYKPPCTITAEILRQTAEICDLLSDLSAETERARVLRLRRLNRVRTIRGSLAIEGNTLDEAQITAILEGKRVLAPHRDIVAAQNALKVYDHLHHWQPHKKEDLLEAHGMLMYGLLDEAGAFRRKGVGVMAGDQVAHMAPPAHLVTAQIENLLGWVAVTDQHPLISGSIFHYEFEFIHPFADGNGRMGRLWQTLILMNWNPLFEFIPVESMVYSLQNQYYRAIQQSTDRADAHPFVGFMLATIKDAILEVATPGVTPQVRQLLGVLEGEMSRETIQKALGLSDRKSFRDRYLTPALEGHFIEMTLPQKPRSRLQKYRKTKAGDHLVP